MEKDGVTQRSGHIGMNSVNPPHPNQSKKGLSLGEAPGQASGCMKLYLGHLWPDGLTVSYIGVLGNHSVTSTVEW